mmetsp:Transcript_16840/g.25319  ORF Transcript_16840/g.25319 Transcript_16840/m.25319 type:complete len:157 (+) Transcript_16840:108-578(+)|eukprot:CAMPEP_0167749678 /NCGR_PEP_ID=MMETSP0110_2-20121227/5550_1 /TAXON_ID=629695 /ORGANISM="Gymnochlora sp., Strain CCMP2014" /LENGTH=156 /DNA_ID=CAMNT_0007634877 /DNA_START=94 /DNA_END=564 /DNA_ORIENTATION=+
MDTVARKRLAAERKSFRKQKPYGFFARPQKRKDGSQNLFTWKCGFPGRTGTIWEGPIYKVTLTFPKDYPKNPPTAKFSPKIYHPNVFEDGSICLSILKPDKNWAPSLSVLQLLKGIQALLDEPNNDDPANNHAANLYRSSKSRYEEQIKRQAKTYH